MGRHVLFTLTMRVSVLLLAALLSGVLAAQLDSKTVTDMFALYEQKANREIPVIVFEPR